MRPKTLHTSRSMLRMPATRSLAMNNIPKRVVCRLWPTECVAEGTTPINNSFMPAATALYIFPAACPAGRHRDLNRFIVMAKSAAPAVGYRLAVCTYFDHAAAGAFIRIPAACPAGCVGGANVGVALGGAGA